MGNKRGRFIVFEGTDGCGKTTQSQRLRERIARATGVRCHSEREPDSRDIVGAVIRSALYGGVRISPDSMAYLHTADRIEHIGHMLPILEKGEHIVCDRYYISSMAYNVTPRVSMEYIYELNRPCREALEPDAIIYLDVPTEDTKARREADRSDTEIYDESQDRVRRNFAAARDFLLKRGANLIVIDASGDKDETEEKIWAAVSGLFSEEA